MSSIFLVSRSNYFKVKNLSKFKKFAETHRLQIIYADDNNPPKNPKGSIAIIPNNGEFPNYHFKTDREINFAKLLSKHLAPNEVAILMTSGHEKTRYVTGWATAINQEGQTTRLCLEDIYEKTAETFKIPQNTITIAEY